MDQNIFLPTDTILKGKSYQYLIEKVLGQGSFGITYLASVRMSGALGSIDANIKVAIKEFFIRDINGRSDATVTSGSKGGIYDEYKRKFNREALNLSKLQHPNIIKVIESFEANNTMYYVMEYISGGSLDDYIAKNNGLKEGEAIKIVKQIGSALSFMHSQGMLHLDLKPSNIMLKDTGDIVVIDFGLSKQYDESGEPESSTKVGAGTPGYAPIEQANYKEGKGFPVTMDVYALGGTLFKMLTGKRPPEASDILNDGFPLFELQEHNVSERTSSSIVKAMAPTKKNRFVSVTDFINSFEEEATVIDAKVTINSLQTDSAKNTNKANTFIVHQNTSKVTIEFYPRTPQLNGAYFCSISRDKGVDTNITQESTHNDYNLSEHEYQKFLDELQSLNLKIRDVEIDSEQHCEYSENPAKLTITLYDNDGLIYNAVWISGWSCELGNLEGDIYDIESKVRQIVPMLQEYIDGPYYEYPNVTKRIRKNDKSHPKENYIVDKSEVEKQPYVIKTPFFRKTWLYATIALILTMCFVAYFLHSRKAENSCVTPLSTKITKNNASPHIEENDFAIPANFVLVPGGQYNSTIHIDSFYIDKYELTQYEFKKYMGELKKENYSYRYDRSFNPKINEYLGDSLPVVGTYRQFATYCQNRSLKEGYEGFYEITDSFIKLKKNGNGYRLANSYEWLFAAKGGIKKEKYEYIGGNKLGEVAWYAGNSKNRPHNVGGKKPNSLGLYDMAGNVDEMFEDRASNGSHCTSYGDYTGWGGDGKFTATVVSRWSAKEEIGDMDGARIVLIPHNLKNANTMLNY